MKVLFVSNAIHGSGGLEKVLSFRCHQMIAAGYELDIVCLEQADSFFEFPKTVNIISPTKHSKNPFLRGYLFKQCLKQLLQSKQYDLVSVCDDGIKALFWPFMFKKTNTHWSYERHAERGFGLPNVLKQSKWFVSIQNHFLSYYNSMVCLSKSNAEQWSHHNIICIPNPIILPPLTQLDLQREKVVLAVGSHSLAKGYDTMLKLWVKVHQNRPEWKLKIIGHYRDDVFMQLAKALGISASVEFVPATQHLTDHYAQASVFLHMATQEAFGMVLIEAMSMGLPCITYNDLAGPKGFIQTNENGILVNRHEFDLLFALIALMDNPNKREQLGANAKQTAKAYLPEAIWTQWLSFYKQMTIAA